jgi:hypothetical protein
MKKWLPLLVFIPFTVFSVEVALQHGPLGFLALGREPWGLQVLLDLFISLFVVVGWIRRDAKERGLPFLPYLVAVPLLGSVGTLAYLVHRSFASQPVRTPSKAV